MQHQYKVIIPNLNVNLQGEINLPVDHNSKIEVYEYDVHEHFKEIRGRNRETQLHLASLLISMHKSCRLENVGLNPNEYCISLLRSCYGTHPLNDNEFRKIEQILLHGFENRSCTVFLCCKVLLETTKSLNCFYFPKSK